MVSKPEYRWDFIGLSTQSKPLPATSENVTDGSTFYEADTSKLYIFYKTQWYEKTATGGGGGYELPIASASTLGGVKIGEGLNIDAETGVLSSSGGGGGPTVVQTAGTSTTDVMSQNAASSLVYSDITTGNDVCIGVAARVGSGTSAHSVAIGHYADAIGSSAVAIGGSTNNNSVRARATASSAIAIKGYASGVGSVAIGGDSTLRSDASGKGSIALGAGATATNPGQVDIGTSNTGYGYNSSNYRLISGVYDPQSDHDAATKGYVDTLITALEARVAALE